MNPFLTEEDIKDQEAIQRDTIPEFLFKNNKGKWVDISEDNNPYLKEVQIPPDFEDNEYFYQMLILKYPSEIPPEFAIPLIQNNTHLDQEHIAKILDANANLIFNNIVTQHEAQVEVRRAELNQLFTTSTLSQTRFIPSEQKHVITIAKCKHDSLLYYFDRIKLTNEFPAAVVANYLKIYKGIRPLPEWIHTDPNCILLIYQNINIFIFIDRKKLKAVYILNDNIDDKILNILQFGDEYSIIKHEIEYVRGTYLIKDIQVRPNIMAFLAKNDPLFRKYIQINEFNQASRRPQ